MQNNEAEALRSWRSALDQIYYHNAYRVPPNYRPATETEKALRDSLRDMEMQCKERVDLLEALRKSREEVKTGTQSSSNGVSMRGRPPMAAKSESHIGQTAPTIATGQGAIPVLNYPDLSRPAPPLPQRPALPPKKSSEFLTQRSYSSSQTPSARSPLPYPPPPALPAQPKSKSRTPSPEKRSRMLTTLRTKDGKKPSKSPRSSGGRRTATPAASSKAAGLAWDSVSRASGQRLGPLSAGRNGSTTTVNSLRRMSLDENTASRSDSAGITDKEDSALDLNGPAPRRSPPDILFSDHSRVENHRRTPMNLRQQTVSGPVSLAPSTEGDLTSLEPPTPPPHDANLNATSSEKPRTISPPLVKSPVDYLSYRSEYPPAGPPSSKLIAQLNASATNRPNESFRTASLPARQRSPQRKARPLAASGSSRRPVGGLPSPQPERAGVADTLQAKYSDSGDENTSSSREADVEARQAPRRPRKKNVGDYSNSSKKDRKPSEPTSPSAWEERINYVQKHLPSGVDEGAAKQIFNEIVVQGDEVHWDDVAGLDIAKKALKEAVVYPFLRPDLFMGLREPARGMLLFGPPGTGKTMLARAVATESRSTFFAISASSLTSKWLGESEKLVRALFSLAKALAPSIIFVDEIDSLLSSRGGSSEHESTRRIKTEFLIQWSDLQRAAAGKAQTDKEKQEGDASRVLVLAATNMPWAIDEAARRRFVRRQYIPLPEDHVRGTQLQTLLGHQKHSLSKEDIDVLVRLTDGTFVLTFLPHFADRCTGFSGSDITALAKDAAMGPLRSLGEALLFMSTEEIRPIQFQDFEASLVNIRPSVSKQGLQEFEDWAKEFGERGG